MAVFPDIVQQVNALLPVGWITSDGNGVPLFGAEQLARQDKPPRVVWVPTTDSFGPAQQRFDSTNPRATRLVHTAKSGFEAHLWGADTASTLAMRDSFFQALRQAIGPNYHPDSGRWVGQEITAGGRVYVLSFTLDIPIADAPAIYTTLTGEVQTDIAFTVPAAH